MQPGVRVALLLCAVFTCARLSLSQSPQTSADKSGSPQAVATFKSATRMVTIEVVARDGKGHHVTGLKADDFQVFEQTPSRGKAKHEQKIAAFREVRVADLHSESTDAAELPAGVYSNAVTPREDLVPPTILLVDGLNTDAKYQAQVHVQMVRMLKSLPNNIPVAVFLFGHRLQMLQDFTTDPSLLQAALENANSTAGAGVARLDPRDDPDTISASLDEVNAAAGAVSVGSQGQGAAQAAATPVIDPRIIASVKHFEQEVYASTMDLRVQQTIEALISLGRHVGGYPGRKNLLWISTTFPIYLSPLIDDSGNSPTEVSAVLGSGTAGMRNYSSQLKVLARVLSEAKVAVYPINPAGVQVSSMFQADNRIRDRSGKGVGDTLRRESMMRGNEQDTMQMVAEGTGGQVCTGTNDLSECIRKAVDDSSTFYEIAYYPDSQNWNGEYRTVIVKSKESSLRLAYRQGYYARLEGGDAARDEKTELRDAACEDYLDASSILLTAKSIAPDSPDKLKFYLTMRASDLTIAPSTAGGHDLDIVVAVCTFDEKGWPVHMMSDNIHRTFNDGEFQSLESLGALPHILSIPGPKPVSVRLLVKDVPSGRLGSIYINVAGLVPTDESKKDQSATEQ
jgi:VWFA-related protein